MSIKIRRATIKDLKQIQELNLALFKKEVKDYDPTLDLNWTFSKAGTKYFKGRIEDIAFGGIWVAFVGEEMIAYLSGGITKAESYRKLPRMAELENTFVEKEYRSKGIGKKLYKEFVAWCKRHDVKKLRVVASAQNKQAIRFYRKSGFKNYDLILEQEV